MELILHIRAPKVEYLVSRPNGNSFPDWNIGVFVVWIYRKSANKSNSRLIPTFPWQTVANCSSFTKLYAYFAITEIHSLLLLHAPFHPCLACELSLRAVEIVRTVDQQGSNVVWFTKETNVKSDPQPYSKTFVPVRRKRHLLKYSRET